MLLGGMRELTFDDARAACMGGLVFGAGGGGLERGLEAARTVFQVGTPVLVGLDELEGDDQVMIMTGVGAPGTQQQLVWPRDGLRALELACEAWEGHGALVGTMTAHPGAFMAGTWLANALDPHLAVIDCNANGRGHPTVAMGGMGLAGRTDINVVQAAVGGVEDHRGHIEIVARGPVGVVSDILHHASAATGGVLLASRGPVPRRLPARARRRGRRLGLHPPRRGDDRGRGPGRRGHDHRDQDDARRPRAGPRRRCARPTSPCARTGTSARSRSTAARSS